MPVSVRIQLKNDKIDISAFSRAQIEKASYRAINKAMEQVKTQAIREITTMYRFTASDVRPGLGVLKANAATLTGKLLSSPRTTPLVQFNPVEVMGSVKTKFSGSRKSGSFISQKTKDKVVGLTVEIIRGHKVTMRDAFLFFGSSVNPSAKAFGSYDSGSFEWDNEKQGRPIKLKTVSITGALQNDRLGQRLQAKAAELYEKTYLSQLQNIDKY